MAKISACFSLAFAFFVRYNRAVHFQKDLHKGDILMKTWKSLTAFLLALSFLAPTALSLQACNDNAATIPPTQSGNASDENQSGQEPTPEPEPEPNPEPQPPAARYAKYIKCTGASVNIRAGAGTNYAVLGSAEKNTRYAITGQTGQWYKTYYRGKEAYLHASYMTVFEIEQSKNEAVENVISEGYKLLGVPYVYGAVRLHNGKGKMLAGFTAQKFDCSSLVQYIFYKGAGKILQVNTRTQIKQGEYVPPSDLQRGDCIFFTNESRQHLTGIERVGHVAVYLGNNYILHTASDYARIEQISAARWNFYIEARRFV